MEEKDYLFSPAELQRLLNQDNNKFDKITASLHLHNLLLRPLHLSDYTKSYLDLLSQHTLVGEVSLEKFTAQFQQMQQYRDIYFIIVIEDLTNSKIIATGTLELEHKFIHSAALRGRLEDVVIDKEDANYRYTDNNLAVVVLDVLTSLGKIMGCYKISLESEEHLLPFYNKFGYVHDQGQKYMVVRYRS